MNEPVKIGYSLTELIRQELCRGQHRLDGDLPYSGMADQIADVVARYIVTERLR